MQVLIFICDQVHNIIILLLPFSNVQCGQLHCMSGDFQANPGVSVTITTFTIGSDVCRYVEYLLHNMCSGATLCTEHSVQTLERM